MSEDRTEIRQQALQEISMDQGWDFLPRMGLDMAPENAATSRYGRTRAVRYDDLGQERQFDFSDIRPLAHEMDPTAIVIENVNLEWMKELSQTLNINAAFFREHACNPEGPLWGAIFGSSVAGQREPVRAFEGEVRISHEMDRISTTTYRNWHVDGVFEWKPTEPTQGEPRPATMKDPNVVGRRLEYSSQYGWQANTCISHYQNSKSLYIFLVDAPIESPFQGPSTLEPTAKLQLPVSHSRGGLTLPPLFGNPGCCLFNCLKHFFTHAWHLSFMMRETLSPAAVLWLLAASTWSYNLRELGQNIENIAFKDVRRPRIQINDRLHDRRQSLVVLRKEVTYAKKYMPRDVEREMQGATQGLAPNTVFGEILAEAEIADRFLMDTFHLLMSSISVLDSETSIQQAQSSQKLTQLAFIFIPLNLVTSMFGMNIMEVNGSPIHAWVCVVVLVVVIACTIGLLTAYNRWEKYLAHRHNKVR